VRLLGGGGGGGGGGGDPAPVHQRARAARADAQRLYRSARVAMLEANQIDQRERTKELFRGEHEAPRVLRQLQRCNNDSSSRRAASPRGGRPVAAMARAPVSASQLQRAVTAQRQNAQVISQGLVSSPLRTHFDYETVRFDLNDRLAARFGRGGKDGDPASALADAPVNVEMRLQMDFAAVSEGAARTQFEAAFVADTARLLGCDPAQLVINELVEGSVIVKFTLKAPAGGGGAAGRAGGGGGGESAVMLGARLNDMVKNPNSALAKSKLLGRVDRARGLLVAAKPLPKELVFESANGRRGVAMVEPRHFDLSRLVAEAQRRLQEQRRTDAARAEKLSAQLVSLTMMMHMMAIVSTQDPWAEQEEAQ
jgi:hypothetical protein